MFLIEPTFTHPITIANASSNEGWRHFGDLIAPVVRGVVQHIAYFYHPTFSIGEDATPVVIPTPTLAIACVTCLTGYFSRILLAVFADQTTSF